MPQCPDCKVVGAGFILHNFARYYSIKLPLDTGQNILLISRHVHLPQAGAILFRMDTNNNNNFYRKFTIARDRTLSTFSNFQTPNLSKYNLNIPRSIKRNHFIYSVIAVLLVIAFLAGKQFSGNSANGSLGGKTEAPKALATQELNKEFSFPLKDDKGKEVAKISYLVESANLQDAFIYQGKVATAVKGRSFLIFNLKITNPYTKTIEINAKDYLRVKVNNSSEQLAPEIHNDPVQIQANSTKYTRIGLPINDSDKNMVLLIGELQGQKQKVNLDLKK